MHDSSFSGSSMQIHGDDASISQLTPLNSAGSKRKLMVEQ